MGKKRIQAQSRNNNMRQARQVRQVRPKNVPVPAPSGSGGKASNRQRQRYVEAGGMLQGYAPESIVRLGIYVGAGALACVLIAVALFLLLHQYSLFTRIVAAVVWVAPIMFALSLVLPGFRLALKDRKAETKVVQGQLLGASEASTSIGLGMIMIKTRGGQEQYLVPPEKLSKVPGNQVNVILTVTPNLRHVRSVGVMGQRMIGRPDQPIPPVLERLRLLPLVTPAALAAAAIIGVDVVAALPLRPEIAHPIVAIVAGAALTGAVFGVSYLLQRRLYAEVQSLMPGGLS